MEVDWTLIVNMFRPLPASLNTIIGSLQIFLEEIVDDEVERNEFLQQSYQAALYLQNKSHALPNLEALSSSESQSNAEDRKAVLRLSQELRTGIETIVESLSVAIAALASSPEQGHLLQESYGLALSLLSKNRELLVIAQKFDRVGTGHFSTLRTKIKDLQLLILTLEQLGLTVALNAYIRGGGSQQAKADVVAVLKGGCDIGWSRNPDGSFDLITDLWGISQTYDQTKLISSINRQYEQNTASV